MSFRCVSVGIFLIACLGVVLTGCGRLPERPNPSELPSVDLFTQENCQVGCWRELYPGITSEDRVAAFFENEIDFPFFDQGHMDDFNWYVRGSSGREDEFYVEAEAQDGILSRVWLSGPFNLTLEDIIDHFGEPEIIATTAGSYGDIGGFAEGQLLLFYPRSGYSFTLYYFWGTQKENGLETCLKEDDVITHIFVFSPVSVEDYIAQDQNLSEGRVKILDVWPGYSCIVLRAH